MPPVEPEKRRRGQVSQLGKEQGMLSQNTQGGNRPRKVFYSKGRRGELVGRRPGDLVVSGKQLYVVGLDDRLRRVKVEG